MSHLGIVANKRFAGVFWTQFIGAFTDNLFKNALTLLVLFKGWSLLGMGPEHVSYLAGVVFIAPFFIFSATAGQLADKLEKSGMIQKLKALEIVFSVVAVVGLYIENLPMLMLVLVFFSLQAAFFGPIKYGILPQLLDDTELVAGNALVEMATNVAILLGTIVAGVLIHSFPPPMIGWLLFGISILGWMSAKAIPLCPSQVPELRVEWNPIPPTLKILKLVAEQRSVFNSVLGISWFWMLGGSIIGFFPVYAKDVLFGDEEIVTLLLAVFSIGVGVGSLWCERLSRGKLELGLVPIGSLGISLFCFHLYYLGQPWMAPAAPLTPGPFLNLTAGRWILFDLFGLATASGFFIVPLYTLIQQRCRPEVRSRIIAGNNIVNALAMVGSYLGLMFLRSKGWSIPGLFGLLGLVNAGVAIYIYSLIPEFTLRFVSFLLTTIMYRFKVTGEENLPDEGGLVLVCNHVSFVDWLIVAAGIRRPIRFVMWFTYYQLPVVRFLFRDAGAIPISNSHIRPKITERAFVKIKEVLEEGEVLGIFPEGKISKNGQMVTFRPGIEKIIAETPVSVVPMALKGLWGSNFSRKKGGFFQRFFNRPLRSQIELVIGKPVPADQVTAAYLQTLVAELRGPDPV
jgi:1-acyl-sn-glycerol-3-phosphate acyltransferase